MAGLGIVGIEDALRGLVENLDREGFLYDFLSLYDIPKATVTRLRKESGTVIKNKLQFEQVAIGVSCENRVVRIEQELADKKSKPRYIIVTDFVQLAAKDLQTGDSLSIAFSDLPAYADFFLAWNGVEKVDYAKENPADIKAAERFTRLYDELRQINQFEDKTTEEKEFNLFLIRLLFLLFAEDTEIMPKSILTQAIKTRTAEDGSDLTVFFNQVFASLDRPFRDQEENWLKDFPYVNGKLFAQAGTALLFDRKTRKLIIEAGELLNWDEINPDILGAMIQTVANKELRSSSGMHYTSVPNIMKVIKPLFLDQLTAAYEAIVERINANEDKDVTERTRRDNRRAYEEELEALLTRLSTIRFFDPACGSGNFLIITYKEIRRLEIKVLKSLRELRDDHRIDFFEQSRISLNKFYGIELDDFAHEVARLSLWIAEHQMNVETEKEINLKQAFLPLKDAGRITQGNALRLDWNQVVPHQPEDEIYLIGNPPYIGYQRQTKEQKEDKAVCIGHIPKSGSMDYVACWFFKGVEFINTCNSKLAFVTTTSICQGEQVSIIWKNLLEKSAIEFAYPSFQWGNFASNNAGVTVAIIGLANLSNINEERYLFREDLSITATSNINAYLSSGEDVIVEASNSPLNGLPKMVVGCMLKDGGHLTIVDSSEKDTIIDAHPNLKNYIKPFIRSEDFIQGKIRHVFWLREIDYENLKDNPIIADRVEKVRQSRLASPAKSTQAAAKTPYAFVQKGEWEKFLDKCQYSNSEEFYQIIIPKVSSEKRQYVPMGFLDKDNIISAPNYVIYDAPIWVLGLLMSRLHMVWLGAIGGKLETRYSYSSGVVYNTFPVPELSTRRKNLLEEQVMTILMLREELGGTLADLYNRETMPESLREEHRKLDELVERAYKDTPFTSDEERLSHLLKRYKEMVR